MQQGRLSSSCLGVDKCGLSSTFSPIWKDAPSPMPTYPIEHNGLAQLSRMLFSINFSTHLYILPFSSILVTIQLEVNMLCHKNKCGGSGITNDSCPPMVVAGVSGVTPLSATHFHWVVPWSMMVMATRSPQLPSTLTASSKIPLS